MVRCHDLVAAVDSRAVVNHATGLRSLIWTVIRLGNCRLTCTCSTSGMLSIRVLARFRFTRKMLPPLCRSAACEHLLGFEDAVGLHVEFGDVVLRIFQNDPRNGLARAEVQPGAERRDNEESSSAIRRSGVAAAARRGWNAPSRRARAGSGVGAAGPAGVFFTRAARMRNSMAINGGVAAAVIEPSTSPKSGLCAKRMRNGPPVAPSGCSVRNPAPTVNQSVDFPRRKLSELSSVVRTMLVVTFCEHFDAGEVRHPGENIS